MKLSNIEQGDVFFFEGRPYTLAIWDDDHDSSGCSWALAEPPEGDGYRWLREDTDVQTAPDKLIKPNRLNTYSPEWWKDLIFGLNQSNIFFRRGDFDRAIRQWPKILPWETKERKEA